MKIGFFDSGLGGLSIMHAVRGHMPEYEYVYYGDTKHVPYGDRPEEEICALTEQGVQKLFDAGALLVIIACNTASAETLRRLQDTFLIQNYPDRKILGVIIPTIEEVLAKNCRRTLLVGTRRTIDSRKYFFELQKVIEDPESVLSAVATPELVPLIESGQNDTAAHVLSTYITPHVESGGDSVILGCTHYCVLKDAMRNQFPQIEIFAQDEIIPQKSKEYLKVHPEIQNKLSYHKREQRPRVLLLSE